LDAFQFRIGKYAFRDRSKSAATKTIEEFHSLAIATKIIRG
jgi:hypothetical protein